MLLLLLIKLLYMPRHRRHVFICTDVSPAGGGKVGGASLQSGKMRGTVRGINARRWVICEAQRITETTAAAVVVVGCEPLKRN